MQLSPGFIAQGEHAYDHEHHRADEESDEAYAEGIDDARCRNIGNTPPGYVLAGERIAGKLPAFPAPLDDEPQDSDGDDGKQGFRKHAADTGQFFHLDIKNNGNSKKT